MTTPTTGDRSHTTATPAAPSTTPTGLASSTSTTTSVSSGSRDGSGLGGQHNGTPPAAALTTVWKPPCTGGPISWDRSRTVPKIEAFSPCLPESWAATGYFSPAICPSGYVSICARFRDDVQGPAVEAGETAVLCGPPGFTCNAKDPVYAKSGSYDAPMIQIRWQVSDLSVLQTHPLSPTTASQATTTGDPSATTGGAAAVDKHRTSGGGGGLPPGVIAAIIVGSMVAVALMVLAGLLIYRHRQACGSRGGHCRRHDLGSTPLPSPGEQRYPGNLGHPQEAELPGNEAWEDSKKRPRFYSRRGKRDVAAPAASQEWQHQQQQKHRSIQELPGHDVPWEMGDYSRPSELAVQEAVCGPSALPREPSPLYHHHHHYNDGAHHPVSEITLSTMAEIRASPTPVSEAAGSSELEELRARHALIEARRERLRELQRLDEEEGRVRRRLAEIDGGRCCDSPWFGRNEDRWGCPRDWQGTVDWSRHKEC